METEDELHPIEIYQESDQLNGYGTVFTYFNLQNGSDGIGFK
jgi:hypothetical protein